MKARNLRMAEKHPTTDGEGHEEQVAVEKDSDRIAHLISKKKDRQYAIFFFADHRRFTPCGNSQLTPVSESLTGQ